MPALAFSTATSASTSFLPVPTPDGIVVAIDENDLDGAVLPTVLVAFDESGAQRWRVDLAGVISTPVLDADGVVWTARARAPHAIVAVSPDGLATEHAIDGTAGASLWLLGMDGRGRLLLALVDFASDGSELFAWEPCLGDAWRLDVDGVVSGRPAFGSDGDAYVIVGESVVAVSMTGEVVARHEIGAFVNGAPAALPSGEVAVTSVVGTGIDDATSATRVHAMRRTSIRSFDVPRRWSPGRNVLAASGELVLVRTWEALVAVDATSGAERWTTWVHPNLVYDLASDESGHVVLLSQSIRLLDGASGTVLWTAEPPDATTCTEGLAIDRGTISASQCNGSLFALTDR